MNKYHEALEYLAGATIPPNITYEAVAQIDGEETAKHLMALQELVDKATPKKPNLTIHNCFCPNCKEAFGKKRIEEESLSGFKWFQYCPYCGQRLDWSEKR